MSARSPPTSPQYDFLNGSVASYSPSNYLNVARLVLAEGVQFDEAIVFIDISDTQDEAAYYRDIDASGAVTGPERHVWPTTWYSKLRLRISRRLLLTNYVFEVFERNLVRRRYYHLNVGQGGDIFDFERSAWTYRKASDVKPGQAGYAPLGLEGGIAKEKAKMTLLWQELAERHIPISVVLYPWPAQIVHDTADSWQVRIWRDWCEGKCKRFISLFPAFFAVRDQCPHSEPGCWYLNNFIFGDYHYNPAGNALVANAVIKSLEAAPAAKAPTMSGASAASKPPPQPAHRHDLNSTLLHSRRLPPAPECGRFRLCNAASLLHKTSSGPCMDLQSRFPGRAGSAPVSASVLYSAASQGRGKDSFESAASHRTLSNSGSRAS